jgi:hypothetical protein
LKLLLNLNKQFNSYTLFLNKLFLDINYKIKAKLRR